MNELLVELSEEGRDGLRILLAGGYLKPHQLALTIFYMVTDSPAVEKLILADEEAIHGEQAIDDAP